jgi:hypothetical protein
MNFFRTLRKKIRRSPSADFDQKFWNSFHKEFSVNEPLAKIPYWRNSKLLFSAASIALIFGFFLVQQKIKINRIENTYIAPHLILNQELYENIDTWQELDGVELSEADWAYLLTGVDDSHG